MRSECSEQIIPRSAADAAHLGAHGSGVWLGLTVLRARAGGHSRRRWSWSCRDPVSCPGSVAGGLKSIRRRRRRRPLFRTQVLYFNSGSGDPHPSPPCARPSDLRGSVLFPARQTALRYFPSKFSSAAPHHAPHPRPRISVGSRATGTLVACVGDSIMCGYDATTPYKVTGFAS